MGIFHGKFWSVLFLAGGIVALVTERQFGSASIAVHELVDVLFGTQQVVASLPPAQSQQTVTVAPLPVVAASSDVAQTPSVSVSTSPPVATAPPDLNQYVIKKDDFLWELVDGQMVKTDDLPKGTVVEKLGSYQGTDDYTQVAELDTSGKQIKIGAIYNNSIEPVVEWSTDEETSIADNPPSVTFLTIQSVRTRIVESPASQRLRNQSQLRGNPNGLMNVRRLVQTGCCRSMTRGNGGNPWGGRARVMPFHNSYQGVAHSGRH